MKVCHSSSSINRCSEYSRREVSLEVAGRRNIGGGCHLLRCFGWLCAVVGGLISPLVRLRVPEVQGSKGTSGCESHIVGVVGVCMMQRCVLCIQVPVLRESSSAAF